MAHLHFVAGLICSGKSTLCKSLAAEPNTLLISEDHWLKTLFGPDLQTMSDYVTYSKRLHAVLPDHIAAIMANGTSVVLDFPANTLKQRAWLKAVADYTGGTHTLHVMETPIDVCRARLSERNAAKTHEFHISEEQFEQFSAHYVPPTKDEGFAIKTHGI